MLLFQENARIAVKQAVVDVANAVYIHFTIEIKVPVLVIFRKLLE